MTRASPLALAMLAGGLLAAAAAAAPGGWDAPTGPLGEADLDERPGAAVPLEVTVRDASGRMRRLGDHLRGAPAILVLGYYHCPMLCGRVLEGTADALRAARDAGPLPDFRIASLSIDPRDGPASAGRRQARVLAPLGWDAARWPFLTAADADVRRVAGAVGFRYARDPRSGQYAHPAALVVLTPQGTVSSYLYGIAFEPEALRQALRTAAEGGSYTPLQRALLRCFQYAPALRRYADAIALFLRVGATAVTLATGVWLALLWRRDLRRGRVS